MVSDYWMQLAGVVLSFTHRNCPSDLHFDTRLRRVTTGVRVFGVKSQSY